MQRRRFLSLAGLILPGALAATRSAPVLAVPPALSLDPRLIGTWVHEKMINSGGANFASFTTVQTVSLQADGRAAQWVRSVGGGSNWNYDSAGARPQVSGRWGVADGVFYLQPDGGESFQPVSRYRFSDPYLVTESQQGRMIWQRR